MNLRFRVVAPALAITGLLLGLLSLITASPALSQSAKNARPRMGLNLGGIVFWTPEVLFVDLVKQGSGWISQKRNAGWAQGGPLKLTPDGWPASLEPEQFAEVLLFPDLDGRYPGGKYRCLYEGEGKIEFGQSAIGRLIKPGEMAVDVDPKRGALALRILETKPANPIKNVRLIPADVDAKTLETEPFDKTYLKRLENFEVLRFMDLGHTNNNKVTKWSERTKKTDVFQGMPNGVAWEYQIQLANLSRKEPWFCIPHLADDDYVENLARLIQSQLDAKLTFYIEYSNETWNGMFEQTRYCREKGQALNLSPTNNPGENQLRYSATRSAQIFAIFEKVFQGRERFRRVLAAHSENPWTIEQMLSVEAAAKNADAIAVAPYFGHFAGSPENAASVIAGGLDKLFIDLKADVEKKKQSLQAYAAIAKKFNLELVAYEGGQHLVGIQGQENNEELMKLFIQANRDPRMAEIYRQDLANWKECGGGLHCTFASVSKYGKWGSWGLLEYHTQEPNSSPKWTAIQAAIADWKKGN